MSGKSEDRDILAAEYALGTLSHEQRQRAKAHLRTDRSFARRVDAWSRRLAPLLTLIPPLQPSRALWPRIEAVLAGELGRDATPNRRPQTTRPAVPLLERLGFWRWATGGAVAVATALALYIGVAPLGRPPDGEYVAVLDSGPGKPAWLVSIDTVTRQMTVRPYGDLRVADGSYELWLVPGPEARPRSLGLLNPDGDRAIQVSAGLGAAVTEAAAFAVSLEPAGGSATGLPSGPVVYQGAILSLAK